MTKPYRRLSILRSRAACRVCGAPIAGLRDSTHCQHCHPGHQGTDRIPLSACRAECRARVEHYRRQLEATGQLDYADPPPLATVPSRRRSRTGPEGNGE